jgi:hypothetical protein
LRFLYVPAVVFYEGVATSIREQMRQKTRRAARMIQSALANRDMVFRRQFGTFGTRILPLRFLMMLFCPPALLVGSVCLVIAALYAPMGWPLVASLLILAASYVGGRLGGSRLGLLYSLLLHQYYLLAGLVLSTRKYSTWRPVERVTAVRNDNSICREGGF